MDNRVHPFPIPNGYDSSLTYISSKRENFTVWMKSLVMRGNGLTVYNNENGKIVYRIDNYDQRHIKEVYLMDLCGNIIFTIKQRVCLIHEFILIAIFFF